MLINSMTNCKNFANWLFETNIANRNKLAFVDNNQSLTYGQLENHVKMFARQLIEANLLPQQRIIICLGELNGEITVTVLSFRSVCAGRVCPTNCSFTL